MGSVGGSCSNLRMYKKISKSMVSRISNEVLFYCTPGGRRPSIIYKNEPNALRKQEQELTMTVMRDNRKL